MDLVKIGKFIAYLRKRNKMTQEQLAEKLGITDRAVSKWERGLSLPDASLMIPLCNELNIKVNELLNGEMIKENEVEKKTNELLLQMAEKEEAQNKKLMFYEDVIGYSSLILFLTLMAASNFFVENEIAEIILFILAFIILIGGVSLALKIETEAGYYECGKCHRKYVPKYMDVYFAMNLLTTRYLKCPKCNKKSWAKKVMSK